MHESLGKKKVPISSISVASLHSVFHPFATLSFFLSHRHDNFDQTETVTSCRLDSSTKSVVVAPSQSFKFTLLKTRPSLDFFPASLGVRLI